MSIPRQSLNKDGRQSSAEIGIAGGYIDRTQPIALAKSAKSRGLNGKVLVSETKL